MMNLYKSSCSSQWQPPHSPITVNSICPIHHPNKHRPHHIHTKYLHSNDTKIPLYLLYVPPRPVVKKCNYRPVFRRGKL